MADVNFKCDLSDTDDTTSNPPITDGAETPNSFVWGPSKNLFLGQPTIIGTKGALNMIEWYRRVHCTTVLRQTKGTEKNLLLTDMKGDKPLSGTMGDIKLNILKEDKCANRMDILYYSLSEEGLSQKKLSESDNPKEVISVPIAYKFKMQSLQDFFAKDVHVITATVTDPIQILRELSYRDDAYATQNDDGNGYCKQDGMITDDVLRDHIAGTVTVGVYLHMIHRMQWLHGKLWLRFARFEPGQATWQAAG